MGLSVNNFGWLPFNPDVNLDSIPMGAGTDRPVGFTFTQIFNLYWTVKSFSVNASVIRQPNLSMGGILSISEAMSQVALVGEQLKGQQNGLSGNTTIKTNFKQELRKAKFLEDGSPKEKNYFTWNGIQDNNFITSVRRATTKELSDAKKDGVLTPLHVINSKVNEGTLLSSGPIHTLNYGNSMFASSGGFTLDLSSIVFRKRLYWPRILIIFDKYSSLADSGIQIAGGVNVLGSIVPLYMDFAEAYTTLIAVALGSVTVGKRSKDRFYFDDKDKERESS
jgi:hypothetical protein